MKAHGHLDAAGLNDFLLDYPQMAIRPTLASNSVLKGDFVFSAQPIGKVEISDSYRLCIEVPSDFPRNLPKVIEVGSKIPRRADHHVNSDGTLCLGSPLRLLRKLSRRPTMVGFAENCLVPYLYAISHKRQFGGDLPFNELAHGTTGVLQDYVDLFDLDHPAQAKKAFRMLGIKKRQANKLLCPCGCQKRLGKCRFNYTLREFRKLASRSWFRARQ